MPSSIEYSVVGMRHPPMEGVKKVTGAALYTTDIRLSGMLHARVLRSSHAHARIRSINTADAEKHLGVKAILTFRDVPRIRYGAPASVQDEYILDEVVRFVGDKVAVVAATSPEAAEEALELIQVDYETLPAVFDPQDAMEESAPRIHGTERNLVVPPVLVKKGDVERGFREADYVFEDTYKTQRVSHCTMEPRACVAAWDKDGKLTIWVSAQGPYRVRNHLSSILGIRPSHIRVLVGSVGGAFGSKGYIPDEPVFCALLSRRTGRPVSMILTRREQFYATVHRHATIYRLKTSVSKDGLLIARQAEALFDKGAYANMGPVIVNYTATNFATMYRCPNVRFEGCLVYTNNPVAGAYRGFGGPQTFFAVESQLDDIAHELRIDPVDIRLRNLAQVGDETFDGFTITSTELPQCIQEGAKRIGWWRKREEYPKAQGTRRRGVGMACGSHKSGLRPGPEMSSAFVKINEDGTVDLLTSVTDVGTGVNTVLAQMVAEVLGLSVGDIKVYNADTDITPFDQNGASASRMTYVAGGAARLAALDARDQLFKKAAKLLDAKVEDLYAGDRKIYVRSDQSRSISMTEVLAFSQYRDEKPSLILGQASYRPAGNAPNFQAQFVEVEVDTETGEIRVLSVVATQDVGFAINPLLCEGQIEGGLHHGLGMALTEKLQVDDEGKTVNPSFQHYRLLTTLDMPREAEVVIAKGEEPTGPFGAKGGGEPAAVPTSAAVANAIYHAIDVRIRELPITQEEIWRKLHTTTRKTS